jgi:hypothetical protein
VAFLDRTVRHVRSMGRRIKQKGGNKMALFTIMHIYEVPARNLYEAEDEFMEARGTKQEKVFLVKTIIRESGAKAGKETVIDHRPPAKWGTIFKRQITGK